MGTFRARIWVALLGFVVALVIGAIGGDATALAVGAVGAGVATGLLVATKP